MPGPNGEDLFASPNPAGWLYNTVNNVVRNMIRADQQWASRLLQAQAALSHRQPFSLRRGPTWNWKVGPPKKIWISAETVVFGRDDLEELAAEENLELKHPGRPVRRIKLRFPKNIPGD